MNSRLRSPGTNPDVCEVADASGRVCAGRMSTPIRGFRTGLWIRTCTRCGERTHTTEPPPAVATNPPRPIGDAAAGPLFTTIETVYMDRATPKRMERVAKQVSLFDRKRRAARDDR
jgi:hypothetical protein